MAAEGRKPPVAKEPPKPLTEIQRRAATLIGSGLSQKAVAEEVGVSADTVSRWMKRGDFRILARQAREVLVHDISTPEGVLRAGLVAMRGSRPDWSTRIAAAKALLGTPIATPEAQADARQVVERIYVSPDEDHDDGGARPDPRTDPFRPQADEAAGAEGSPSPVEEVAAGEQQGAEA